MSKRPADSTSGKDEENAAKVAKTETVPREIRHVWFYVKDEDEAKDWLMTKLGFKVNVDSKFPDGKGGEERYLTLSLPDSALQLVMAGKAMAKEIDMVGKQAGDGMLFVLETPDIKKDFDELTKSGVQFKGPIKMQPWGEEAIFTDLYGNQWDLHHSEGSTKPRELMYLTWLVNDVEKAKIWFHNQLGFQVTEDKQYGENGRWLTMRPSDKEGLRLTFCAATSAKEKEAVGHQSFVITTPDAKADFELWKSRGVQFEADQVKLEKWGYWNSFKDMDGNTIGLTAPPPADAAPSATPA